jgi:hypothetical protein
LGRGGSGNTDKASPIYIIERGSAPYILSMTKGEEQIDPINRFLRALAGVFPATAGLGGAARGLERELKGIGTTQEKTQW